VQIIRRDDDAGQPAPSATFTGDVRIAPLHRDAELAVNRVSFRAGARTYWHTHEHGQLLLVTAGQGWVAGEDGTRHRLGPGDLVWTGADETHWHGATEDADLTHLAVSLGVTTWFDEVADERSGR